MVDRLLAELARCGEDGSVAAVALVGSRARGETSGDSDVDVVLIGDRAAISERQPWGELTAPAELVGITARGAVEERRYLFPGGLELEINVAERSWAGTGPVDPGTRRVVEDGLRALADPEGLLRRLREAVAGPDRARP